MFVTVDQEFQEPVPTASLAARVASTLSAMRDCVYWYGKVDADVWPDVRLRLEFKRAAFMAMPLQEGADNSAMMIVSSELPTLPKPEADKIEGSWVVSFEAACYLGQLIAERPWLTTIVVSELFARGMVSMDQLFAEPMDGGADQVTFTPQPRL